MAIKSVFFWIVNSLKLTITHQDAVVLPFTLIKVSVPDVHVCFLLGPISHQTNSGKQNYRSDEHQSTAAVTHQTASEVLMVKINAGY